MQVSIVQFVEGLKRARRMRKDEFSVFELGHASFLHLDITFFVLAFRLRPELTLLAPQFSGFWTQTNYATDFPSSPTYRQ